MFSVIQIVFTMTKHLAKYKPTYWVSKNLNNWVLIKYRYDFLKYTESITALMKLNAIHLHVKAEIETEIEIDVSLLLRAYYIW